MVDPGAAHIDPSHGSKKGARPMDNGSRSEAPELLLSAMCGRLSVGKGFLNGNAEPVGAAMCPAYYEVSFVKDVLWAPRHQLHQPGPACAVSLCVADHRHASHIARHGVLFIPAVERALLAFRRRHLREQNRIAFYHFDGLAPTPQRGMRCRTPSRCPQSPHRRPGRSAFPPASSICPFELHAVR